MKKIISFILAVIFFLPVVSWGQILIEDFNYGASNTDLVTASSSVWINNTGGTTTLDVQYQTTSLSYGGYASSGIGGSVFLTSSKTGDDYIAFSSQTTGSIFISMLISVSSVTTTAAGEYALHLGSTSTHFCRLYLRNESGNLRFGISKSTEGATFSNNDYAFNTTYLVILKYTFNNSTQDDRVDLWVISTGVPATEEEAGIATVPNVVATTTDASSIGSISLRQGTVAHSLTIDGLRVATSWSQAPLPVELTSFKASNTENGVQLNWETATEVNNYGFNVERGSASLTTGSLGMAWETLGFVQGHGNSNSPKEYSFSDNLVLTHNLNLDRLQYRLKQIDFDGKFEYSNIVEVNVEAPAKLVLYQNSPNPFNPTTEIKFALPKLSNVELSIYNMLGEKIQTLANGMMNAGEHKVAFNASNLSSGVYLYKLTTDNVTSVRKMILMK